MKTVELFAGTGSFSKVMKKHSHETYTVDNNASFGCDETWDLKRGFSLSILAKIEKADIVWMSPPCTTFSMASGNTHWTADRKPRTKEAEEGEGFLRLCKWLAGQLNWKKKLFFIENPNGRAVWFLPDEWLKRVWYCQYGDTRAKPTNIWTNLDIKFRTCKRNNPDCDHERAPRGSKTGTQGLNNSRDRSVIPPQLFEEILDHIKNRDDSSIKAPLLESDTR